MRLRIAFGIAVAGVLAFASGAGAQSGVIEGDVYLLTRGREVRPGAANTVYLLPRDPAFADAWTTLCREQTESPSQQMQEITAVRTRLEQRIAEARDASERAEMQRQLAGALEAEISAMVEDVNLQARQRSDLIRARSIQTASTGMNAHYRIEAGTGPYWLFAEMALGDSEHRWLVPVDVGEGAAVQLDLDNNNLLGTFSCDSNPFTGRK